MAKKILVVDDDLNIVKVVESRLKANGYEVTHSGDGLDGIKKATSEKPDLILLDVNMPHMNGLEALKKLKNDEGTKPIPVIMFTARHELGEIKNMFASGAVDYISKPFDSSELLKKIERVLVIFSKKS